jgi:hypothetical protein
MTGTIKKRIDLKNLNEWIETRQGLYLILILSAVLKFSLLLALSEKAINEDGVLYISAAQQFALGDFDAGLALYPMPVYSFLIMLVHFLIPNWVLAARIISITSLVFVLFPLYLITKELFGRRAAFWAGIVFAIAPQPNSWAMDVIRGPVFILFFAWASYFAVKYIQLPKITNILATACFAWISVFFRIEGIIFIPFFLIFLIVMAILKKDGNVQIIKGIFIWIAIPLFSLAFLFSITDLTLYNYNRFDWVMSNIKEMFNLQFLDNYHKIYDYLKNIENSPPFTGWQNSFATIARKYMPVVYLLGALEVLIKTIFPLNIIPLLLGLRCSFSRSRLLILTLTIFYFVMVYYSLIARDILPTRFLFVPAFFLFPWIGRGMERILKSSPRSLKPKSVFAITAIVFLLLPVVKSIHWAGRQDKVICRAGEWLTGKSELQKARMIATDPRIPFYAGRNPYSRSEKDFLRYDQGLHNHAAMEQYAKANHVDVIIVRVSKKKKNLIPNFEYYNKLKEFKGRNRIAIIYISSKFNTNFSQKDKP